MVIYRLTVQTLPDCLETKFTLPDMTQTGPSCLVVSGGRCDSFEKVRNRNQAAGVLACA